MGRSSPALPRTTAARSSFAASPPDYLDVFISAQRLVQNAAQGVIQLYGDDLPGPARELRREAADAGADLEREGVFIRAGGLGYAPGHGGVDEEVLAQRLGEAEAVPLEQRLHLGGAGETYFSHL